MASQTHASICSSSLLILPFCFPKGPSVLLEIFRVSRSCLHTALALTVSYLRLGSGLNVNIGKVCGRPPGWILCNQSLQVEDETTVYKPSTLKLMGKPRALKAIPLDHIKPDKTESSPAKEQVVSKRPANTVSGTGTPAKRRKVASAPDDEDSDMEEHTPRRSTRIRA